MSKCHWLLFCLLLLLRPLPLLPAEEATFEELPLKHPASAMALTSDGVQLIVAHGEENQLSVWDVASGKLTRTVECETPVDVLCRDQRVFVATGDHGAIAIFQPNENWARRDIKVSPEADVGRYAWPVWSISAAKGDYFDNKLFANCKSRKTLRCFQVDVKEGQSIVLGGRHSAWTEWGYRGTTYVTQFFHRAFYPTLYLFLPEQDERLANPRHEREPVRLTQPYDAAIWIGGGRVYDSARLMAITPPLGRILVADQTRQAFYAIDDDRLRSVKVSLAPRVSAERPATPPDWVKQLEGEYRGGDMQDGPKQDPSGQPYPPAAATLGDTLYLFTHDPGTRKIHRCATPAFPLAEESFPANVVEPMPVMQTVTTIAMTEDGKQLLTAHEAENLISVWDIKTGRWLKNLSSDTPRAMLVRRGKLYVASPHQEVVDVFDSRDDWKQVDQLLIGETSACHLSAPSGRNFRGNIYVTCPKSTHGYTTKLIELNVDKDQRKVLKGETNLDWMSLPTVSYDGKRFVKQSGKRLFQQHHPGTLWVEQNGVYGGDPLTRLTAEDENRIFIPDVVRPRVYTFADGVLSEHRLDETATRLKSRPVPWVLNDGIDKRESPLPPIDYELETRSYRLRPNLATTIEGETFLFLFDTRTSRLLRCRINFNQPAALADSGSPVGGGTGIAEGAFPASLATERPFRFRIDDDPAGATMELVKGPEGIRFDEQGVLHWTPQTADIGRHELKIKVVANGELSFRRYLVEIVKGNGGPPVAAAGRGPGGRYLLGTEPVYLTYGHDYRSLLMLHGDQLRVLGAHGLHVVQEHRLEFPLKEIHERPDYYVGLSGQDIVLLNKNTLAVEKRITLADIKVNSLAINPAQPECFATVEKGGTESVLARYRVARIDERLGIYALEPDVVAKHVAIDPSGSRLYAAMDAEYQKGAYINLFTGRVIPINGVVDLLVSYAIDDEQLSETSRHENPGAAGIGLRVAPHGKQMTYLSKMGYLEEKVFLGENGVPVFDADKLSKIDTVFSSPAPATDVAFHPVLDIAAAANRTGLKIFSTTTGQNFTSQFDPQDQRLRNIGRIMFTPGGHHLLVEFKDANNQHVLQAFPLKLNEAAVRRVGDGARRPAPSQVASVRPGRDNPPEAIPVPRVPREALDALVQPQPRKELEPVEIGRKYLQSVVVVWSKEGFATGFFIGREGYVLTCKHALAEQGDTFVYWQVGPAKDRKTVKAKAQVIREDPRQDLALLKIETEQEMNPVNLAKTDQIEAGARIVSIGYPGLGSESLRYTMTRGVVSNPNQRINGMNYLQTDAAINPGSSGGPVFDSHGRTIGLVVLKGNIEGAGFAVPQDRLLAFLEACIE